MCIPDHYIGHFWLVERSGHTKQRPFTTSEQFRTLPLFSLQAMEWKFSQSFKKSESTSFPRRPLACTVGEGAAAGNLEVWAQILQSQVAAGIKCFYKCHVWLGLKIGRTFQMSQLNNKGCSKTSLGLNPSSFKARQAQILNISHFQM